MAEIKIAGTLHNTEEIAGDALHSHVVTNANEVLDTVKGQKQSDVNAAFDLALADRYTKEETYSRDELDNLITTPDVNYVAVATINALSQEGAGDTIYRVANYDGSSQTVDTTKYSEYAWDGENYLLLSVKSQYVEPLVGYYSCAVSGSEPEKAVSATNYVLTSGGAIKIRMEHKNTAASGVTLNINSTGAKALLYNGEPVDASNSWDDGEVVEVYFDPTHNNNAGGFFANNVAGGSGSGDGAFDVSVKYPTSGVDGGNTYTLEGALAVLDANLSASKKKGGMSIKFVQSSDNKYVQYRLMHTLANASTAATDFTNTANWQGVDDEPTAGSDNLVKSGGVYADTHLCNVPEVNDFVVDIVLKEGVSIDFTKYDAVRITDLYEMGSNIRTAFALVDSTGINADLYFVNTTKTNCFYTLLESEYCYIVLRHVESRRKNIAQPVVFYRDISWESLSSHPVISELLSKGDIAAMASNVSAMEGNIAAVENDIAAMESDIESLDEDVNGSATIEYEDIPVEENRYWKIVVGTAVSSQTSSSYKRCELTPCSEGDVFVVTGTGGRQARLWCFADSEKIPIEPFAEVNVTEAELEVTAPKGAAYAFFNCVTEADFEVKKKVETRGVSLAQRISSVESSVATTVDGLAKVPFYKTSIPKMDFHKSSFKILDIGNSYSNQGVTYLNDLLSAAGITTGFSFYRMVRSSSGFNNWYNVYKGTDTSTYRVNRVAGDVIPGIDCTDISGTDNTYFINALKQEWDVIIIHQKSSDATSYDGWESNGGRLNEFIQILRTYCPKAVIGTLVIHSYYRGYSGNEEGSTSGRWANIAKAVMEMRRNYGIDFIIPYGTAVENMRMTSLNDGNDFTNPENDGGVHLVSGIGMYTCSCAYFEALFAPRYNVTVLGNSFTKTDISAGTGVVQITAANALLAQKAAVLAMSDMFSLRNPETTDVVTGGSTPAVYGGADAYPITMSDVAPVAITGSYNDLSNKPNIPDVSNFISASVNNLENYYLKSDTYTKAEVDALLAELRAELAANNNNE